MLILQIYANAEEGRADDKETKYTNWNSREIAFRKIGLREGWRSGIANNWHRESEIVQE